MRAAAEGRRARAAKENLTIQSRLVRDAVNEERRDLLCGALLVPLETVAGRSAVKACSSQSLQSVDVSVMAM
jgi:hypothetical protein